METVLYELKFVFQFNMLYLLVPFFIFAYLFWGFGGIYNNKRHPAENIGGIINRKKVYYSGQNYEHIGTKIISIIFLLMFIVYSYGYFSTYYMLLDSYKSGKGLKEVSGVVENFHPMPEGAHDTEHFTINGVRFDFSVPSPTDIAYNLTKINGGVIKGDGQKLVIKYVQNGEDETVLYIAEINQ
jgi:hypothetical protein